MGPEAISVSSRRSVQAAEAGGERVPVVPLITVVIEHQGDAVLRDRLVRGAEVLSDMGDLLVARADMGLVEKLREQGLSVSMLEGIGSDDELFWIDRSKLPEVALSPARELYAKGDRSLVALEQGCLLDVDGHDVRASCHSGHERIATKPIAPLRTLRFDSAAPVARGRVALGTADPRIQALVDQVDDANLESWVVTISSSFSRNSTQAGFIDAARNQIVARLQVLGFSPTLQAFDSGHGDNIVLEIPGQTNPASYVVLGAHYDSRNLSGATQSAPGADDNATGSSALLEIARILSTAGTFENTWRLVWFAGEEYGLLGSEFNADQSASAGHDIIAMLNTDMNAYRAPGDVRDCDFVINNTSSSLRSFCAATSALYVPSWASVEGSLTAGTSDHASYNSAGFPAAFFFEDAGQYYSQIHTASDAYPTSTNDFLLAEMITKGILASAAVLADPIDLAIAHVPLSDTTDAVGPYTVVAQVSTPGGGSVQTVELHYSGNGGSSFTTVPMTPSGSDYVADIPALGSPLTIQYFITASDDQGGAESLPEGADVGLGDPFEFFVGTRTFILLEGFETAGDNGWTHGQIQTQDDWQRGTPNGSCGDPPSAYAGTRVWGNDLAPSGFNGCYANNVSNWLRSPVVNCSAASNVHLQLRRWLQVESGQFDQATIRINGTTVWQNPFADDLLDDGWTSFSLDVSALAAGNSSVQIEFRLVSDGGLTFGGWNVDDVALVELGPGDSTPPPFTYCTGKTNSEGCVPFLTFTGGPSVSSATAFRIVANDVVENQIGFLLYTINGKSNLDFHGGKLCVKTPFTRLLPAKSSGNTAAAPCKGELSVNFNNRIQSGSDPDLTVGQRVHAQWRQRDPFLGDGFNDGLSNGIQFVIAP
jgi:hypothetical protein